MSQAIAMAGGLAPKADGSDGKYLSVSEKDGGKETLSANIYEIEKGKDRDVEMKEMTLYGSIEWGKGFLYRARDTVKGLIGLGLSIPY